MLLREMFPSGKMCINIRTFLIMFCSAPISKTMAAANFLHRGGHIKAFFPRPPDQRDIDVH